MVELQSTWTWLPAIYLFLGGVSAGSMLVVALLKLAGRGRFKTTVSIGAWVATIALACGLLALVAEVEKPLQAMVLFKSFVNPTSWMTVGAWVLFASIIVFGLFALVSTSAVTSRVAFLGKSKDALSRALAVAAVPLAVVVAVYTGILLSAAPSIPLWGTWLLPVLFTVSAFDTGVAAVAVIIAVCDKEAVASKVTTILEVATACLIVVEGIVLSVFLGSMSKGTVSESLAAGIIVDGELSMAFWTLVVAFGLVVPFVAALAQLIMARKNRHSTWLVVGAAACVLMGGFVLRYVVLAAGIHGVIVSPDALQAASGVIMMIP
ncbi:MAG: polysulfide reductase NrfD [Slackia sp.]|nr:polysulfide reductase NrfD [Slackia sp.]